MTRWVGNTIAPAKRSDSFGARPNVRSYVEGRGAKDLRTGVEADLQSTLDGELDHFLKAALARPKTRRGPKDPIPE